MMTDGAAPPGGHRGRGVASIPGRTSLNVQLGPASQDFSSDCQPEHQQQHQRRQRTPGAPRASHQPKPQPRVRWSRMAVVAAPVQRLPPPQSQQQPPPPPSPPVLALASAASAAAAASGTSASLCQLVDFGETRDLIRRQREASKKLVEVSSIMNHLSLDKENSQNQVERCSAGWSTFRPHANSQFKQYVFQSPGRAPKLPPGESMMQRSRTTLGLPDVTHGRQDGCIRESTTVGTATATVAMPTGPGTLQRASSNLLGAAGHRGRQQQHLWSHGNGSSLFSRGADYRQLE